MKRRKFITLLGGAAAAWPLAARAMKCRPLLIVVVLLCIVVPAVAQNTGNLPLVGVLRLNTPENVEPIPTIFRSALAALGQVDGRNIRIEFRLAAG